MADTFVMCKERRSANKVADVTNTDILFDPQVDILAFFLLVVVSTNRDFKTMV